MTKNLVLITIVCSLLFSACTSSEENNAAQTNLLNSDLSTTTTEPEVKEFEMSSNPPLTEEEGAKYVNTLPLADKKLLLEELALQMPAESFIYAQKMFPDFRETRKVEQDSFQNLMQNGIETWYFSPQAEMTLVVSDEGQIPVYLFGGENPTDSDVADAKKLIEQINTEGEEIPEEELAEQNLEEELPEVEATDFVKDNKPGKIDYNRLEYDSLISNKKAFVLYFHADWCSVCQGMEAALNEDLINYPDGTKILKVNFDNDFEMREKYQVVMQSTMILVNSEGEVEKRLVAPGKEEMRTEISALK